MEDLDRFPGVGGSVKAHDREEPAVEAVGAVRFQIPGSGPGIVEADPLAVPQVSLGLGTH